MAVSHFQEKSGTVPCKTPWGRWWQTVQELNIEVDLPQGTRARDIRVDVKPSYIRCQVKGNVVFEGKLCRTVVTDETTWTVEEQKLLYIQMTKADPLCSEQLWTSLLEGQFIPDAWTFHEMQKKIDLEKFQIEIVLKPNETKVALLQFRIPDLISVMQTYRSNTITSSPSLGELN